jgi:hypothetical protein
VQNYFLLIFINFQVKLTVLKFDLEQGNRIYKISDDRIKDVNL